MNRDDIIRMAREADLVTEHCHGVALSDLQALAALIAEDCAKRCEAVADGEELPAATAAADRCAGLIREAYKL